MATSGRSKPSLFPALMALIASVLIGYFLYSNLESSRQEHLIGPPIEIIDPQEPVTVIKPEAAPLSSDQIIEQEAKAFIETLAKPQNTPITIEEHQDAFVRHDSVIVLPESDATLNADSQTLSIKDILPSGDMSDNALFYLHRVTKADLQGLWGIIQAGLIDKFREGIHIEGIAPNKEMVQAIIPANADEKLASGFSSFLGKILNQKVNTSYIYNFNSHTMSRDPNLIRPGQQLILIHFAPNELTDIYQFFSDKRNQGVDTFAIDG